MADQLDSVVQFAEEFLYNPGGAKLGPADSSAARARDLPAILFVGIY